MAKHKSKKKKLDKKLINKDKKSDMSVDQEEKIKALEIEDIDDLGDIDQFPEEVCREQQLENDVAQWKDKYVRTMAEFENFRRRTQKEKSDWIKSSNEEILLSICDIMDNFERAMGQMKDEHHEDPFIKGIVQIKQQLDNLLIREHVVKIESDGAEFDPAIHEALAHIPADVEENKVVAVIQNGYKLYDKIIRTARVAVSNGQPLECPQKQNNNNKQ